MFFRQLFDAESSTYSYLIADEASGAAALIDPVREQASRDGRLIQELGFSLSYLLETHIHADHVTGSAALKALFPQAQTVVSRHGGADCADRHIDDGDQLPLGNLSIQVLATPGHTAGCVSYFIKGMVFSGDALFIRGCGRTDFQEGDPGQLYDSVTQKLFQLPDTTLVYPGHNYCGLTASTIGEEKRFNPRLAGKTRQEFIALMQSLQLAPPKKLHEAVPANLKCGNLATTAQSQ